MNMSIVITRRGLLWLLAGFVAGTWLGLPEARATPQPDPIRLNEILADPASDWDGSGAYHSRDDEWVEIVNTGTSVVDLSAYRLAGADTTWRYEFSGFLDPGQVRVVYGSESYAWEQANGHPAFGLRLSNSGGTLLLFRLGPSDTTQVDCYTYLDHEADDDRSTGRAPDGAAEWRVFDAINLYSGTTPPLATACSPSPGAKVSCPTPVETTTWGRLKRGS